MKTKDTSQAIERITIRISEKTHEALIILAKKHKRSLNSEIDWGLQVYIKSEEKKEE